jgi:hypothetical protein
MLKGRMSVKNKLISSLLKIFLISSHIILIVMAFVFIYHNKIPKVINIIRTLGYPLGTYDCTLSEYSMGWASATIKLFPDGSGRYAFGSGFEREITWQYDSNTKIMTVDSTPMQFSPPGSLFNFSENEQRNSIQCTRRGNGKLK